MAPTRDALARQLFERALLRGTFTLRSGVVSDRYFDKYRATTDPTLLAGLARALDELRIETSPGAELIVAPELGAVPLAAALALASGLPFAIVRTQAKDYGTANAIEGVFSPGQTAVLLEDVVTSGGAALAALATARDAGLVVEHSLCVLDRGAGGATALAAAGAPLTSVLTGDDLAAAFDADIGTHVSAPVGAEPT